MAGLNALFDKRKLALARARIHAWWEGEDFDEAAAEAAFDAAREAQATADAQAAIENALFDAPPFELPGRLVALGLLWGEGRIRPGEAVVEAELVARLAIGEGGLLAVLGPGLEAPLAAMSTVHPGGIETFEWREETFAALEHGVSQAEFGARVGLSRIDLESHVFAPAVYDGLLSVDDFAYCSFAPHLAQQMLKCLKPGARAIVECYVGEPSHAYATAFASCFAEPQIRPASDLTRVFGDTGFLIEAEEDVTDPFLATARAGFKRLGERLNEAGGLSVSAAQELAWEAQAWRARMSLLAQRRLERRRFVLQRPHAAVPPAQSENENAPAG